MSVLTIKRSKWKRAGSNNPNPRTTSRLLDSQGYMCCLGFDAIACGVSPSAILDVTCPWNVTTSVGVPNDYRRLRVKPVDHNPLTHESTTYNTLNAAIGINDNANTSDSYKEEQLVPLLKKLGWDNVVFVD